MKVDVVSYKLKRPRKVRGTDVGVSEVVYAVQFSDDPNRSGKYYFIWSYVYRESAKKIAEKMHDGPTSETDFAANYRRTYSELVPTGIKL